MPRDHIKHSQLPLPRQTLIPIRPEMQQTPAFGDHQLGAHDYFDVYDKPLSDVGCAACPYPHTWPCADREHAVAALRALDECQWDAYGKEHLRLVYDPAPPTENTT